MKMDFYQRRAEIFRRINEYITKRDEVIAGGFDPPKFAPIRKKLMLKYGASDGMIRKGLEVVTENRLTLKDGELATVELPTEEGGEVGSG